MGALLIPLKKIATWLGTILITILWDKVANWYDTYKREREERKIREDNLAKYEQAIREGLPSNERAKRAENLLNGTDTRSK